MPDPIRRASWNFDLDDDWDSDAVDEPALRAAAIGAALLFLLIAGGVLRALLAGRL